MLLALNGEVLNLLLPVLIAETLFQSSDLIPLFFRLLLKARLVESR